MRRFKIKCDDQEWVHVLADDAEAKDGRVLAWTNNVITFTREAETATIKMLKDKSKK